MTLKIINIIAVETSNNERGIVSGNTKVVLWAIMVVF